jgi:hypothetical protein
MKCCGIEVPKTKSSTRMAKTVKSLNNVTGKHKTQYQQETKGKKKTDEIWLERSIFIGVTKSEN